MRLKSLTDWAERRVTYLGRPGSTRDAFLAALWGLFGAPIIWVVVTPLLDDQGPEAALYGLGAATVLALVGYAISSRLIRPRRR